MTRSGKEILDKIKELKGLKTDVQLAKLFGVKQNTVTTWRKRGVPYNQLIALCDREKIPIGGLLPGRMTVEYKDLDGQRVLAPGVFKRDVQEEENHIDKIKISEDLILATRVLESRTEYATALHLNIRSFARAVNAEERIGGVEASQRDFERKMQDRFQDMEKKLATLQDENRELRKEVNRLTATYEAPDGGGGHLADTDSKE